MRFVGLTDTGLTRTCNQDTYRCEKLENGVLLAVLCDGMGGERAGDVASQTAAQVVEKQLTRSLRADMNGNMVRAAMQSAVAAANATVYEKARQNPDYQGMGTTLIVLVMMLGGRSIFLTWGTAGFTA
jgi:protein phosphatase